MNSVAKKNLSDNVVSIGADLALEVRNISVNYRSYKERPSTLKESLVKLLRHRTLKYYSTFEALSNLSFSVKRGEVFGIIGSNGAGKSTLLKVLAGVLKPTKGNVIVNGVVDSLIQLGAGFDPELNAIENIYLSGSLHKKTKSEIQDRIPNILEFAELEDFATTPIKYYSSGMFARLGFAVAIDRNPDILIVDEVLAVGDERFQQKSLKVFEDFLGQKKTIIMVTHNLVSLANIANTVGLLAKGKLVYMGNVHEAIKLYLEPTYETRLAHSG